MSSSGKDFKEIDGSTTPSGSNSSIVSLHSDQTKQILVEHALKEFMNKRGSPRPVGPDTLDRYSQFPKQSPLGPGPGSDDSDSGSDSETVDTSDEEGIGQRDNIGVEEGGAGKEESPIVLDAMDLIQRTSSQGIDYKIAKRVIEHPKHGTRLLTYLLDHLLPRISSTDQERYLELARYAVETKPSLLRTVRDGDKMTPLQIALQKSCTPEYSAIMASFIKKVCDEANAHVGVHEERLNPCQQAIHHGGAEGSCLHYAIEKSLDIATYLVEMAGIETLLTPCGSERQTVLHVALQNVVNDKGKKDRKELINAIIEKVPEILLEVNAEKLSPYRYFKRQMALRKGRNDSDQKDQKYLSPSASSKAELERTQVEKDRWNPKGSTSRHDFNSMQGGENDRLSLTYLCGRSKATQRGYRSQKMKDISELLKDKCLESATFSDTLKALYGSMEGNEATWLNLLNIELPLDFHKKLEFRALDKQMAFVAVRAPKGGGQKDLSAPSDSNRILKFFKWLKEKRKVRSIMKVIVRDDTINPSGDQVIEAALKDLNVQYLDWDRVDISCKTLHRACPSLRELELNCSGNNAVLHGWADKGGLNSLEKLKSVTLYVSQGWDNVEHMKENLNHLKSEFENAQKGRSLNYPKNLGNNYNRPSPTATVTPPSTKDHRWLSLLKAFTEGFEDAEEFLNREDFPRVCIIDDGASLNDPYIIKSGRSFGQHLNHSSNPGECFPSVDGHGASMARIIYNLCPCINLYVAKLERTGGRGKFTMKDAKEAILWAIGENVDVISMSWTLDKATQNDMDEVMKKIRETTNCPAMFCASRDQGSSQKDSQTFPFCCSDRRLCNIGAANEYGVALPQTSGDATYLFPCHGLDVWGPSDHRVRSVIEGSSDATALAAGLAALILLCEGALYGRRGIETMRTLPNMKILFNTMVSDGERYVQPRLFDNVMKQLKQIEASPQYRQNPMKPKEAFLWPMRQVSSVCHSAIHSHSAAESELWKPEERTGPQNLASYTPSAVSASPKAN